MMTLEPGKVDLTEEQREVLAVLRKPPKQVMSLGGYAGTGKTTLIRELIRYHPHHAVVVFTGKAANVLRRKGILKASTIHSRIYAPEEHKKWIDDDNNSAGGYWRRWVTWDLRDRDDIDCDGFIVDEASMVSRSIHDDLLSFDLPVIFVGDHGQLEPVQGRGFCIMTNPDLRLETIHRNAGEIARFAQFVREGNRPANWARHPDYRGQQVRIVPWDQRTEAWTSPLVTADQVIVATNRRRVAINRLLRAVHDRPHEQPVVGDRVMVLQNDRELGVFNGMQGEIKELLPGRTMVFSSNGLDYSLTYDPEAFNRTAGPQEWRRGIIPLDYCYAVTCHKAQGDEWDRVTVLEERCGTTDHARWAYTAASRARQHLTWVTR